MPLTMPKTIITPGRAKKPKVKETIWDSAKRSAIENIEKGIEAWEKKTKATKKGKCWQETEVRGDKAYKLFLKVGTSLIPLDKDGTTHVITVEEEVLPTLKAWSGEVASLKKGKGELAKSIHEAGKVTKKPKTFQGKLTFDAMKDTWLILP